MQNSVAKFTYNGGSNPGSTRTVIITDRQSDFFRAYDVDKGEPRTFSHDKVSDLRHPPSELVLEVPPVFLTLGEDVLRGKIEELLQLPEHKGVCSALVDGVLYVWTDEPQPVASVNVGNSAMSLVDKNSNNHLFSFHNGDTVRHYIDYELQGEYTLLQWGAVFSSLV